MFSKIRETGNNIYDKVTGGLSTAFDSVRGSFAYPSTSYMPWALGAGMLAAGGYYFSDNNIENFSNLAADVSVQFGVDLLTRTMFN